MAEGNVEQNNEEENNEEEPLVPPRQPTYLNFRLGREEQVIGKCTRIVLTVFKGSFSSLGLWAHQWWNYFPRILFMAVCIYQVVYRLYVDCGCPNFNCHFVQNSTDNKSLHKGDVATGNTVFTIVSLAAVISYIFFIISFFVASRLDSALVPPSETMMIDINKTDAILLFLNFLFIIASFIALGASLYTLPVTSEIRDPRYTIAVVTGTGAQLLVHWASINTCQVFAVSSLTIGMLF